MKAWMAGKGPEGAALAATSAAGERAGRKGRRVAPSGQRGAQGSLPATLVVACDRPPCPSLPGQPMLVSALRTGLQKPPPPPLATSGRSAALQGLPASCRPLSARAARPRDRSARPGLRRPMVRPCCSSGPLGVAGQARDMHCRLLQRQSVLQREPAARRCCRPPPPGSCGAAPLPTTGSPSPSPAGLCRPRARRVGAATQPGR